MKGPRLPLCIVATALALSAAGCSRQPSKITGPAVEQSSARAPLISRAAAGNVVPESYIVVFKQTVGDVDRETADLSARHGFRPAFRYKHAIKGFAGRLPAAVVEALQNDPRIAYIEQDQIAHAIDTQTNPPSWGLDRVDQRSLPLDYSYTYNQTGAGVDAYIIDTGIRITHTDFGGRAVAGVDEITPGGTADDGNGHGTHVAGTVGGAAYGIAKGVRLIAVRVLNSSGTGTYSQVIAGVDWVTADHTTRPAVANMSLGGALSTALDAAVRNSVADGVTYCVAAGNSLTDASSYSPADVVEAITVGAVTASDTWASFSNYGSVLDILAPGVSITSDWNTSDTATNKISGTSMATPHVTGAAALYLEANPTASPAQVAAGLASTATANRISSVPAGTVNLLLCSLTGAALLPTSPAAPILNSPAEGSTGVSTTPTLSWIASAGASTYEVQVSTSPTFATLVSDQPGLTTTSTTVSGLAYGTLYYWRVNAASAGGTSPWSTTESFTTAADGPLNAPTPVSPDNGSTVMSSTPTLVWNAPAGVSSYRVQVSTSSSFTTTEYDREGITSTSVTLPRLGIKNWYYWRVNATNANRTSAYSATWSFRVKR